MIRDISKGDKGRKRMEGLIGFISSIFGVGEVRKLKELP